jgi:hypothetical protein
MASKKALNAKNLEALGASRLADLLIEMSKGNREAQRRLRLELARAEGPSDLAAEIRKSLTAIGQDYDLIEWTRRKAYLADLETQRSAIVEQVAKADPAEALDLLQRFMALADSAVERCEDRSGIVIDVFHDACYDLGEVAVMAKADPKILAEYVFRARLDNGYGQYDTLIDATIPALGPTGLEHLKQLFLSHAEAASKKARPEGRLDAGSDPDDADAHRRERRDIMVQLALQEIADAQGDVDAYVEQYSEDAKTVPVIAAWIARRLLAAGRTDEAWEAINAVDEARSREPPFEWEQARLDILEALGRAEEAQAFRLDCFKRSLHAGHIRAYLDRLDDFEDVQAEEDALAFALGYRNVHQALAFLGSWPAPDHAAELVLSRADELDGYYYELLGPAADVLEARHPLAATVLRRALIDFALGKARATRYKHAARHLQECERLDDVIQDYGRFETHETYATRIRNQHGRKTAFWGQLT